MRQLARETAEWLLRQVAPAQPTAVEIAGREWLDSVLDAGERNRSAKHSLFLECKAESHAGLWSAFDATQ